MDFRQHIVFKYLGNIGIYQVLHVRNLQLNWVYPFISDKVERSFLLYILGLDGQVPSKQPRDLTHFQKLCAAVGKSAKCCVIPIAGLDVLCKDAL